MTNIRHITSPIDTEVIEKLTVGTQVLISGVIYAARDAAHQRLIQAREKGEKLPFDPKGQTLYYMGPSPAPPGQVIGAAGPTTSSRMDMYTPGLIAAGLKAMIGKGDRSAAVKEAITIKKAEVIAYEDLGAEAILRLDVEDFPAVVANDIYGEDLFERGRAEYYRGR